MPTSEAAVPANEPPTSMARALPSRARRAVLVVASTVVLGLVTLAFVLATAEPRPAASVPTTTLVPPVAPTPRLFLAPASAPAPAAATNEVRVAEPPPAAPNPVRRAASRRAAVADRSASPPPTPTTTEAPRSPLAGNPYERR
jgi:hypothetical protein